ncbi:AMP-binding enzyme [Dactylonectria macrodidyma]|uniref:AMP-binding enzyme n=1 Tax=Dactylonectria macrodidyma TaxID=307937 RepID=A0A9P9FNZ1_9HYPO|nr:AMP-binding enzyme [Dactylonectria macrodidyma]
MPIQSRWSTPLPETSLQKWIFGSSFDPLPDRPTFIDADQPDSRIVSFSDFRLWSKKIGLGLQNAGLRVGDRVLLLSGNHVLFPSLFVGVLMAGGVFTGASPAFTPREVAYQLRDSGASFLIVAPQLVKTAVEAAKLAGLPANKVFLFDDAGQADADTTRHGVRKWEDLIAGDAEATAFDWVEPKDPRSTTCCLNYSSGTTGSPKGVEITHFSYVANGETALFEDRVSVKPKQANESALCFLPLYHAAAQTIFGVNYPRLGMPVYVMPAFDFIKMLQHIQNFKITKLVAAPPIVRAFATVPIAAKFDLSSVTMLGCGTAPLAPQLASEAEKLWPNGDVFVRQAWGMTEITCTGTVNDPLQTKRSDSVGEVAPNAAIKLMDGDKEILEPNVRGELWFTGPTLMKGYWNNPKATNETIVNEGGTRWMKTGDIAYLDSVQPGAKIHIVDRIKELIKVKGFQVAPAELEALLLERPDIVDAGVVGVTVNGEEAPRAYLVKLPGSKTTTEEIAKWMEATTAKYKWLRGGIVFTDAIPRVPSGKILRRVLRERAQTEMGRNVRAAKLA